MLKQSQILNYFRVVRKCQNTNEMSSNYTQNENIPNENVQKKVDFSSKKRTVPRNKRVSNGKTTNKETPKNELQLDNNMQVLPGSDSSSSTYCSAEKNLKNADSNESDDSDKNDFVEKKCRNEKAIRNRLTSFSGKSPRKVQSIGNKVCTQSVSSNNKASRVKSPNINKVSSSANALNNTTQDCKSTSGITNSVNIRFLFNDSNKSKTENNKTNVARNIFPHPEEISVQVNFGNHSTANNEKNQIESTSPISQNHNNHEVNRVINITTQGNSTDLNTGNTKVVLDENIPVKKNIFPSKSSPSKQQTLTQMKFKTNKPKVLGDKYISPAKAKTDTVDNTRSKDKKENIYNDVSHNRLCEKVRTILKWVFENQYFKILFTKKEIDLLHDLFSLDNKQQLIICLRLYTRLPKWYNFSNLCKELNLKLNFSEPKEILQKMEQQHFVEKDYSDEPIDTLLENLQREDVKNICLSFKLKTPSKKNCMIDRLIDHSRQQSTLTSLKKTDHILRDRVNEKLGVCIKLSSCLRDILYRIHLLYSLANNDLESAHDIYFLMEKLQNETLKYPQRTIESILIFKDREEFLTYEQSLILLKELDEQKSRKDIENEYRLCKEAHRRLIELLAKDDHLRAHEMKPLFLRRFSAPWVYCTVLLSGSQNLGKYYADEVCVWLLDMLQQQIYCVRKRGLWYIQLTLVQKTHQKDTVAAVQTIINGLSDKLVTEVSKHELSIRGSKFKKGKLPQLMYDQLQHALLPQCTLPEPRKILATVVHNNAMGRKVHFVSNTSEGKEYSSVEQTAITYYTTELSFTDGIHCEGRLLTTLFFILFWDILYDYHVPNTFISVLQSIPLDFYSGEFYTNRAAKISARLKEIRENWNIDIICQFISRMYSLYTNELKSVHPHDFGDDITFHMFVRCIGKNVIAAVCDRLAKDYKQFRSGLPDLFLWNRKELKCCFVEVKSERDTLSTNQILWLHYLKSVGAKVEICYVESIGSRIKKKINI